MVTKLFSRNANIDLKTKQITFLDGRFYYDGNGVYVPSVTTILDAYPKGEAFYNWLKQNGIDSDAIKNDAAQQGSNIHKLTEDFDNGIECDILDINVNPQYSMREWKMFERYVDFRERVELTYEAIEWQLISPNLGYAGTIDRIAIINGNRFIIDIKSSNYLHNSYFLQLAAYKTLLEEQGIQVDGTAILWLNAKTRTNKPNQGIGWQLVFDENQTKSLKLFKATKVLYDEEYGSQKPIEYTYKLSHKLKTA